jgi:hypothetical protein
VFGRFAKIKGHFPLVRISPFEMTEIFQSTNNLSSKEFVLLELLRGKIFRKYSPVPLQNTVTIVFL